MKKPKAPKPSKKRKKKIKLKPANEIQIKRRNVVRKEWIVPNQLWGILLVVFLVFMFFMPREIAYPANRNDIMILLLIMVVFPFLVYKTVKSFYGEDIIAILSSIFLPIIFVFTSALLTDYREEKELLANGKIAQCFVTNRETEVKNKDAWLIKCKYFVDGVKFTTYAHNEKDKQYQIGDTLNLIYNKEFPRMYKINLE